MRPSPIATRTALRFWTPRCPLPERTAGKSPCPSQTGPTASLPPSPRPRRHSARSAFPTVPRLTARLRRTFPPRQGAGMSGPTWRKRLCTTVCSPPRPSTSIRPYRNIPPPRKNTPPTETILPACSWNRDSIGKTAASASVMRETRPTPPFSSRQTPWTT